MALTKISTAGVKDDAVTAAKIPANAVGSSELADNAVDTNAIQGDAVDGTKIADDSINSEHYVADSIDTEHYAAGSVDETALADDAVTTAKIADGAVNTDRLAGNAVTGTRLADGAVTNSKIANDAINSAKIQDNVIVNADINASAAIAGTKIAPNFGSQNIETTGNLTCDGEFQPHWIGHQSQCQENTFNTDVYWKVAEITGAGSEGGQIVFYGTTDYTGNSTSNQAARTTLILRCLTNNQLGGLYWSESGSNSACADIRWKYTGSNNIYEIWIRKGAYDNVIPHITGSFDYAQTFGSTTSSATVPSGSTAFDQKYQVQINNSNIFTVNSGDVIFQNKRMFSASGYSNMNVTYSHDMPCANDSGHGQWFWCVMGHTHYNNSYGCERICTAHCRGTTVVETNNLVNNSSSLGGNFQVFKPTNTTFRVTHNAGSYNYPGRYHITVYCST